MKIVFIVEGRTERVFVPHLRRFLEPRVPLLPKIATQSCDGRLPTYDKLQRVVARLLSGDNPADHVVALTDVYTGTQPADFSDAADAKAKMREWVGNEPRFHPHAAQHDFEAWLLPFWDTIQKLARHNRSRPSGDPEMVNHNNPPAHRISQVFETGKSGRSYVKTRDAGRILSENDLSIAVAQCSELRALMNTFLSLSGGTVIE